MKNTIRMKTSEKTQVKKKCKIYQKKIGSTNVTNCAAKNDRNPKLNGEKQNRHDGKMLS